MTLDAVFLDVVFDRDLPSRNAWPVDPAGSLLVDGMVADQVTAVPSPAAALTPSMSRAESIARWRSDGGGPWHLAIDTGMSRAGVRWDEIDGLRAVIAECPPEGAYTHFHSAELDGGSCDTQEERFREAVAALPERPFVGVVSILDDKDAASMLRALLPRCERFVCTAAPSPRALSPATLASLVEQLGASAEIVPSPRAAVARAQELAGPEGAVIATGSIYLIAELVSDPGRRRASAL